MAARDVIAGIDLGTTKVTTVIAEVDSDGQAHVVGVGHCAAQGMQRGVVINIEKTVEAIRESVDKAQQMADVQVDYVIAGIAGDHIRSINSRGVIAIRPSDNKERTGEITPRDVDRVIEAAKALNLPMDREVLHVLPQEYTVDNQKHIREPIGMAGVRLEADVHIITGAVASAQNIHRCVQRAGMLVQDLVLEPLASSYAVLTPEEKDLGVGLIDIGGGTTDVAVFHEGAIRHTSVIGLGGENVTKDLGHGLRASYEQAERIKVQQGHCHEPSLSSNDEVEIPGIGGHPPRRVTRRLISQIVQPRMEELFELAQAEIHKAGAWDLLTSGLVLTGGASQIEGAAKLAEQVFGLPVKVGYPTGLSGLVEETRSPVYATVVGLVLFGMSESVNADAIKGDESKVFSNILRRMKDWFEDFF